MCKPISFISDGKGDFKYFNFEQRQNFAAREPVGSVEVLIQHADSHASLAAFYKMDEDKSNKYEYDFAADKIVIDQINAKHQETPEHVLAFTRAHLRPLVLALMRAGTTATLEKVVPHVLSVNGCRKLAIFAAEQVLDIFERRYPDDKRPRQAIEAAKKVLENDTEETRRAAAYAASAAYAGAAPSAAYAAYAADAAADDAEELRWQADRLRELFPEVLA